MLIWPLFRFLGRIFSLFFLEKAPKRHSENNWPLAVILRTRCKSTVKLLIKIQEWSKICQLIVIWSFVYPERAQGKRQKFGSSCHICVSTKLNPRYYPYFMKIFNRQRCNFCDEFICDEFICDDFFCDVSLDLTVIIAEVPNLLNPRYVIL